MAIQNSPPDDPYTAADLAAIFAAPRVPMFSNMNPFLEARLQHFATTEVESQEAGIQERDRVSHPRGTGSWAWELAQLFNQGFRQPYGEPFVRFYREASRKLIDSEYVHDKGFDLSYLLFKMKQGKPEELSSGTILRALRQQRKNAK